MVATIKAATVFDAIPLLPTSLSGNRILHRHSTTILGGKLVLIVVIIGIVAVIYSISIKSFPRWVQCFTYLLFL